MCNVLVGSRNINEVQKTDLSFAYWQLPWFAHAARPINLIEIGCRGKIRGSVLPGIKVATCFYFMLSLVLVTSDCGITAKCSMSKSVNTSAAHICTFCETKSLCKNTVWRLRTFCGTNSHNQRAEDQPEVWVFSKEFWPTQTTPDQTPSNYPGLAVVAVLVQNMLE